MVPTCPAGSPVDGECLDVEVPPFPLAVAGWNMERAYPGIEYRTRVAVRGGVYPYTFSLAAAPDGMMVEEHTGRIAWVPAAAAAPVMVRVEVVDSVGGTLTHVFNVEATTRGFFFVSLQGEDSAQADGSRDHPWQTLGYASAPARGHAEDAVLYFRDGVHLLSTLGDAQVGSVGTPTRWMGYPGEHAIMDAEGSVGLGLRMAPDARGLFQGLEFRNAEGKMFWVGSNTRHVVWRNNVMHDIDSEGAHNPAFVFFEDGDARPAEGRIQYDDLVMQDNVFHDLRNDVGHGGAVVLYNVARLLFEDNEIYRIAGRCLGDKDDGFQNIFRHNICHDTEGGLRLENQYTQAEIEVSHNLFYRVGDGVTVGWQPGWLRDVWVHHNTLVDAALVFRWVLNEPDSGNVHVYRNVVVVSAEAPISANENGGDDAIVGGRVHFDGNLYWSPSGNVYSGRWGGRTETLASWQEDGQDRHSVFVDPGLVNNALPAASPYRGTYGRFDP